MKITIDIPQADIPDKQDIISVDIHFFHGKVCECTYPFEVERRLFSMNGIAKFHKVSFEEFYKRLNSPYTCENEIELIYDDIECPTRSTSGSAGYDFRIPFSLECEPETQYFIPTGIKCEMTENYVLQIHPRSSLGMKYGFRLTNTTGIIDSDYYGNPDNEGHIMVCFTVDKHLSLKAGDKLCQGLFIPYGTTEDDNVKTTRKGGIGSTGA